jgi:hypothetical protein
MSQKSRPVTTPQQPIWSARIDSAFWDLRRALVLQVFCGQVKRFRPRIRFPAESSKTPQKRATLEVACADGGWYKVRAAMGLSCISLCDRGVSKRITFNRADVKNSLRHDFDYPGERSPKLQVREIENEQG